MFFTYKYNLFRQFQTKRFFSTTGSGQTEQQIDSLCEKQFFNDLNAELNELLEEERNDVQSQRLRYDNPKQLVDQGASQKRVINRRD